MRGARSLIGLFAALVTGGHAGAQPASLMWSLSAQPVHLSHTEHLRGEHKPPLPPELSPAGREVTGGGAEGRVNEITEGIREFKRIKTFKIGDETFTVWAPDTPTTVSSAPEGLFDGLFDGTATVSIEVSAAPEVNGANVLPFPRTDLADGSYSFAGAAAQSKPFQADFKARVAAKVTSLLQALEQGEALTADQIRILENPQGGRTTQPRKIVFFEDSKDMTIVVSTAPRPPAPKPVKLPPLGGDH